MLAIRNEQLRAFEQAADGRFLERLIRHLREHHGDAAVRLPEAAMRLKDIPMPRLRALARRGVERARVYGLTWESTVTAFVAIMFEVAPNFDDVPMAQAALRAKTAQTNLRLNYLMIATSAADWAAAARAYEPAAWE